jgi:hypothetical protein
MAEEGPVISSPRVSLDGRFLACGGCGAVPWPKDTVALPVRHGFLLGFFLLVASAGLAVVSPGRYPAGREHRTRGSSRANCTISMKYWRQEGSGVAQSERCSSSWQTGLSTGKQEALWNEWLSSARHTGSPNVPTG